MSHTHQHGDGCGHEHNHGEDGDPHTISRDNLFKYIDRSNVIGANVLNGNGPEVIKPWNKRNDEVFLQSDDDDQMIIRIPFTGSVRLRSLLLKTGPLGHTPSKVKLFANDYNLDFTDVEDKTCTQEFDIAQSKEIGEYSVKTSKFSNTLSVSLFFPASQGADSIKIFYVGFLGTWTERNESPVITVYETQANLADHGKIQGMDGFVNTPQT